MIEISVNSTVLIKHKQIYQKSPTNCSWNLATINFLPKAKMQNSAYRDWNFPATCFVYIYMETLRKPSKLLKMLKFWDLKETGINYKQRFGLWNNQWQNTLQQIKISSKIGQG